MSDHDASAAMMRLERAIARIERAVAARPDDTQIAEAFVQLDERHGILRRRIQETIERLDAIIAQEAG